MVFPNQEVGQAVVPDPFLSLEPVKPLRIAPRKSLPSLTAKARTQDKNRSPPSSSRNSLPSSQDATPKRPESLPAYPSPPSPPLVLHTQERKIRPLPPVPKSAPPTVTLRIRLPQAVRPLPSLPPSSESPPDPHSVCISVTPATPLPPPTPHPRSNGYLHPSAALPHPMPFSSLSLLTSPDALRLKRSSTASTASSVVSPLSPSVPQPPTPTTARRKRMSKLRRHLGESIPSELVLGEDRIVRAALLRNYRMADRLHEIRGPHVHSIAARASRKRLSLPYDETGSSDEENQEWEDMESIPQRMVPHTTIFRALPLKRYSKKWIREKGSRRWEERDYTDILQTLRSL